MVATRSPRLASSTREAHQSNFDLIKSMLRNIPNKLTQIDIANAVKHEGFSC